MANVLSTEKKASVISMLTEGSSIRSVERVTGVHRDTVMRLGIQVGTACERLMHETMRDLPCEKIEVDEIWGYVGKKQRQVTEGDHSSLGDVWTFIAIDPESKAVPSFLVGKRDYASTRAFVADVHSRMKNRIQLSSDGMNHYAHAVEESFGADVDYGQIVKTYRSQESEGRYSCSVSRCFRGGIS